MLFNAYDAAIEVEIRWMAQNVATFNYLENPEARASQKLTGWSKINEIFGT